jgi:hypothetical protein
MKAASALVRKFQDWGDFSGKSTRRMHDIHASAQVRIPSIWAWVC